MSAMTQGMLLMFTQRKMDLQLREMILKNRQSKFARQKSQYQADLNLAQKYQATMDANATLLKDWQLENPGETPNLDEIPGYTTLPAGISDENDILALENAAELELANIAMAENHIEIECAQIETELAAIEAQEKSYQKLHDNNIKNSYNVFGSS